ncbi:hypothetical protein ROSEINA2194_03010 [Roseburia inulinivorans DSM 16841]|uniref:Uncharacterized protein n=1 Tax=Roseburia inulinivorans DSM 16841 TaxID=622312 RepID=C0FW83_9FIRM|nr:hypothetical protein ROSEINA2194_03010 [Roseburia inulinivorans DSM 16841]
MIFPFLELFGMYVNIFLYEIYGNTLKITFFFCTIKIRSTILLLFLHIQSYYIQKVIFFKVFFQKILFFKKNKIFLINDAS